MHSYVYILGQFSYQHFPKMAVTYVEIKTNKYFIFTIAAADPPIQIFTLHAEHFDLNTIFYNLKLDNYIPAPYIISNYQTLHYEIANCRPV